MIKKTAAALIALILLAVYGCGAAQETSGAPSGDSPDVNTDASVTEAETTTELPGPDLPDLKYDNRPIVIYKREGDGAGRLIDYTFDELTGDVLNDAVYYRNLAVEEKFAVDVQEVLGAGDAYGTNAKNTIMAGDDAYQLVSAHARLAFNYSDDGLALDWYQLPYVNLDNEWWDKNMLEGMTIGGKLYVLPDDLSESALKETKCYIFNKDMFARYDMELPYQAVRDGLYTFDRFNQDSSAFSYDLDGDGTLSIEKDQYGFAATWWGTPINIIWTAGLRIVQGVGEDGRLEIVLDVNKADDVFTKLFAFFDEDYAWLVRQDGTTFTGDAFREGRLAMTEATITSLVSFRDVDHDIGCVPPPKFYEEMTGYATGVDAGCSGIILPITNGDLDMLSAVLEYWMYLQYKDVAPVYFETVCKTKVARDSESAEMLDLIRANRFYDIGYYLSSFTMNSIGHDLSSTTKGFASWYESKLKAAQKSLDKINDLYFDD
ncbi:MAG: hypothetical protein K6D94_11610 [Clostridiales bacterium]|nr:hypothetical protein [Clostridiales bacterium]